MLPIQRLVLAPVVQPHTEQKDRHPNEAYNKVCHLFVIILLGSPDQMLISSSTHPWTQRVPLYPGPGFFHSENC